jgi:uncharacterized cupin superfamily protein
MAGKVNIEEIPEQSWKSPTGKYQIGRKPISVALGGKLGVGTWGGGHPFDVEWVRLTPGKTNFPYHEHKVSWELYVVLSGSGVVRSSGNEFDVGPGDCFVEPPGSPHQIRNESPSEDLIYLVVADQNPADITYYPDSDKWAFRPPRTVFEMTEVDYFKNEE